MRSVRSGNEYDGVGVGNWIVVKVVVSEVGNVDRGNGGGHERDSVGVEHELVDGVDGGINKGGGHGVQEREQESKRKAVEGQQKRRKVNSFHKMGLL